MTRAASPATHPTLKMFLGLRASLVGLMLVPKLASISIQIPAEIQAMQYARPVSRMKCQG